MYKKTDRSQHSFLDFNQPMGLHTNPDNRWIKMADRIPWDEFESKYAELFPGDNGNVAKPLCMALGSLIIQTANLWNRSQKIHICSILSDCRAIKSRHRLMQAHWSSSVNVFLLKC